MDLPLQRRSSDRAEGMSALIRGHDWAATPLGPIEGWPSSLRFALDLLEHSSFPTAIYWGPDLRLIYNEARAPIFGSRHPEVLGLPGAEAWGEMWAFKGPPLIETLQSGEGRFVRGHVLPAKADGTPEESYWNYSLVPLLDDDGSVGGVLSQSNDVTRPVLAERRLSFQVALADRLRTISNPEQIKTVAARMLAEELGVARAGYGEIDETGQRVSVRNDWVRDPSIPSLAGESRILDAFGEDAIALLRAGETLAVDDYRTDPRTSAPRYAPTWESIGTRALVVVPLNGGGRLRAILYLHEPEARHWRSWEAALARDVAERTWAAVERAAAEQKLRDSEDHYRHAVELNPQVAWTALPDGQLNRVARRWHDWTGTTGLGDSWAEGLHPEDREPTFAAWGRSVATGEPYDIEHRVRHRDGSYRWARSRAFPRHADDGSICLWYGATEDVHERRQAEEHQRLLINELNHRVKNTLATVQAIAFQTLKGDIGIDEARARFEARLLALSRAHNILTEQSWEGASLDRLVRESLGHLPIERFHVQGEPMWLGPRAALALALALHELSTNAVKYGALGPSGGSVAISWISDGGTLRLDWKESGGPAVTVPEGRGFGSRLIERGLAADLGGTARLEFEPDGLRCRIEASVDAVQARESGLA
jgi:PAS domain S-box-containing protein